MKNLKKQKIITAFRQIPGVGSSIANDLWDLGLHSLDDLKETYPKDLYNALCKLRNTHVDRCVLYVFRCATYFVSETHHEPHLLKWWNWKDKAK